MGMSILGVGNVVAAQILGRECTVTTLVPGPGRTLEASIPRAPRELHVTVVAAHHPLFFVAAPYKDSSQEGVNGVNHDMERGRIM
jgi:hypothetical protein